MKKREIVVEVVGTLYTFSQGPQHAHREWVPPKLPGECFPLSNVFAGHLVNLHCVDCRSYCTEHRENWASLGGPPASLLCQLKSYVVQISHVMSKLSPSGNRLWESLPCTLDFLPTLLQSLALGFSSRQQVKKITGGKSVLKTHVVFAGN